MDGPVTRMDRTWMLGGLFWIGGCSTAGDALAQAQTPGKAASRPSRRSKRRKHPSQARPMAARHEPRVAETAAAAVQPSPVRLIRHRCVRRSNDVASAVHGGNKTPPLISAAVGAIVPWPMPPALIIRHTREVHGEVDSLLYGLRR